MKIVEAKNKKQDILQVASLALLLWPDNTIEELVEEITKLMENGNNKFFLATTGESFVGFAHSCIRYEYVEGQTTTPTGYLEGIFVKSEYRKRDISRQLLDSCQAYAKSRGCTQFASDCEIENKLSEQFHLACGFFEESRNIHFIKKL